MRWTSRSAAPSRAIGGKAAARGATAAEPLVEGWKSVLVLMLKKTQQLDPQTLLLQQERTFSGSQEWFQPKRHPTGPCGAVTGPAGPD